MFYEKFQNFQFLTMSLAKMAHILLKRKNGTTIFFEYPIVSGKLTEN